MESNDEKIRVFLAYRDLKEEEIEDVRKCLGDNELELLYIDKDKLNGLKDNDRLPLETYFRIIDWICYLKMLIKFYIWMQI